MRNQYRVTKYDPSLRDANGAFQRDDWTSYSDIGRTYNSAPLSESQYIAIEDAYLLSIEEFLREAGIEKLQLRELETTPHALQRSPVENIPYDSQRDLNMMMTFLLHCQTATHAN